MEKQALEGVLWPVCWRYRVPLSSNKGYSSQSALYQTGQRLQDHINNGKSVVILYFGDHDPSGIDMSRDVEERLALFSEVAGYNQEERKIEYHDWAEGQFTVVRCALNMDQVREYGLPPNPAKVTDSRAKEYIAQYGRESWELDAIPPQVLSDLLETHIKEYIDDYYWDKTTELELMMRQDLDGIAVKQEEVERTDKRYQEDDV